MNLITQLRKNVPDRIFRRGKKYYNDGRIQKYQIDYQGENEYTIKAKVSGTYNYQVKINLQIIENSLYFNNSCTCPYDWGEVCKHEIAVLYRFLKEDYENLDESGYFQRLKDLSSRVNIKSSSPLLYYIKGLLSENMVNFKITITSNDLSKEMLKEIISYVHNPDFPYFDREYFENILDRRDLLNIDYFSRIETRKSRSDASLLFSKNKANFNFLLNLIENREVYFAENEKKASTGKILFPQIKVSGNEKEVEFNHYTSYDLYKSEGEFANIYWTVRKNKVQEVDFQEIERLPEKVVIPEEEKGRFLFEIIPDLKKKFDLELPQSLKKHRLLEHIPDIKLKFDYKEGAIFCNSEVEFAEEKYIDADILSLDTDNKDYERLDQDSNLWSVWKLEECKRLLDYLEDYNFHVTPQGFVIRDDQAIQNFITDGFIHIPEEWEVETTTEFDNIEIKEVELEPIVEFKDDDEGEINWFEFEISYNLGGKSYSRQKIKEMMRYNDQGQAYIKLDNNYYILEEGKKERDVKKALSLAEDTNEGDYRSHYYNLLYYKNILEESGIEFKGNKVYNQLEEDITGETLIREYEIPDEVEEVLRDYQKDGYYWFKFLDKYNFGGILADDMGLGKTIQSLTFLKSKKTNNPALIICPRTLIYNWGEEIDKFFSNMDYLVYHGTPEERKDMRKEFSTNEIIITSYSIISRDHKKLEDYHFSCCILDEAQRIKNHKTRRARGVKNIVADKRMALTGTPLENSLEELWSIFDFLMPGYLGNYSRFRSNYLNPVRKNNNKDKLSELKKKVAPFILRRKKEEVLTELPDKVVNIHRIDMNKLQEDTYRTVLEDVKGNLMETVEEKGFNRSRINVLAALTKLRQICNHPSLVLDKVEDRASSGKVEALMELVEEGIQGGHKLIVFSQFVKMLKIIKKEFEERNIIYEYLDGSTRNRMDKVRHFNNDPEVEVFLISLKAGGTGLNLTSADIVIHVDPWWNPMVERQASDRAHRIGQKERVMVYKLISRGTVEEKMLKLQKRKESIFENVIEDNVNPVEAITWEDIQNLLSYQ